MPVVAFLVRWMENNIGWMQLLTSFNGSFKPGLVASEKENSTGFATLLEEVVRAYLEEIVGEAKIVVVIDNFKLHYSKTVRAALERHKERLVLFSLPTMPPNRT